MSKHQGKVAVITGGTSGLGLATAQRLVREGAFVFVTGRRQAELDAAVKRIEKNVIGVQGDVADPAHLDRLYATVKREKNRIDILFANAGGGALAPLGAVTEERFDKTFDVNVRGLLFTVQKALPLLNDNASIILNASTAGSTGLPGFGVYGASKAAVRSFARTWSAELGARQIRVNAISPGVIPTPGYSAGGMSDEQIEQWVQHAATLIPLGRVGAPDEVAKAVSFLASDDASYVNGIELFVDGGLNQV